MDAVRLVIISNSKKVRNKLESFLSEMEQFNVVAASALSSSSLAILSPKHADIVLVDYSDDHAADNDLYHQLLSKDLPMVFCDDTGIDEIDNSVWKKKLIKKIMSVKSGMIQHTHEVETEEKQQQEKFVVKETQPPAKEENTLELFPRLWLLGASIGGPQAVQEFLSNLIPEVNLSFLLVQHIGESFNELLAEQIERSSPFYAQTAMEGSEFFTNTVMVAPSDRAISIDTDYRIRLVPPNPKALYSPCIDDTIDSVITAFGVSTGIIIFSGMGNDGTQGATKLAKMGGMVWAQEPSTCIISSMPDSVRKAGIVGFSGTPKELAEKLVATSLRYNEQLQGVHNAR